MALNSLRLAHILAIGATIGLIAACDDKDDDDDVESDADTDSDTDSDTDTDTDSDADADSMTGTVEYVWIEGSDYICDATISLTGSAPYAGGCDGCKFSFDVEADITEDNGTDDCWFYPPVTYVEDALGWGTAANLGMAYADTYEISGYYGSYDYSKVFMTGFYVDYSYWGMGVYGPYWQPLAYDGGSYGTFSMTAGTDSSTIDWSWSTYWYDYTYTYSYVNYCSGMEWAYSGYYAYGGSFSGTDDLDCGYYYKGWGYLGGYYMDVWGISLSSSDTVSITVDTVAADTAFDPHFYLTDADTCYFAHPDDSFECTYPPVDYACPSIMVDLDAGDYNVVVRNYGSCYTATGEYEIVVDASSDPDLKLKGDDVLNDLVGVDTVYNEVTAIGTATLQ